ncbi:helix-turn-helix transcriptional regulator [Litoribaculum gwangyangense]|uniref:HTH cro/C1-type domain-containing protein n=1 Tax=Litoribaculum gwangyangense TaxID=1130722 RepID=A0ABP9C1R4_9FLAO
MASRSINNVDNEAIIKLGRRIKFLRYEKNMTQMDVAVLVNIDASAVRRYEKGKVEMGFTTLIKFAEAFEVTVNDLIYSKE